ncbi:endonuclease III [Candidatus Peregrinibacteria bacterium CG10_big_fil_rev_8_21_14_0_10_36_19]|nr:MAG: endonuclease III [Candidatus Peregrinibacteria bacterium CG10_big_fil_rev_8_21_14_0_10_36_19]
MKKNAKEILDLLREEYKDAVIALNFGDNWQLLVAVALSAQCTDERVNKVTPPLFARFPTVKDFAECDVEELEKLIYSTGFYRAKARNIRAAAVKIMEKFGGEVPSSMEDLLTLGGVARKTANVILHTAFQKSEGIVVDTHVARICGKLGFVPKKMADAKKAVEIENRLKKIVPKSDWGAFSHWMIQHGRKVCIARRPNCKKCILNKLCPSANL